MQSYSVEGAEKMGSQQLRPGNYKVSTLLSMCCSDSRFCRYDALAALHILRPWVQMTTTWSHPDVWLLNREEKKMWRGGIEAVTYSHFKISPELETKELQSLSNTVWQWYLLSLHRVMQTLKFYSYELWLGKVQKETAAKYKTSSWDSIFNV